MELNAVAEGGYDKSKPEEVNAEVAAIRATDSVAINMVAVNRSLSALSKRCAKKAVKRSCSTFQSLTFRKC